MSGSKPGTRMHMGTHDIVYEAVDSRGNVGKCTFQVIVVDKEPPTVLGCPINSFLKVYESNNRTVHPI